MNKNLLILGAGQYGTVAKEIAQSMNFFEKISFLDDSFGEDNPNYHEESIGKFDDAEQFSTDYSYAIVAIGNPKIRRNFTKKIEEYGYTVPILVSPRAYVSPSAQLAKGCIVEPLAGVHANAVIGTGTIVSMGAVVNHNSMVMNYCHINCGAIVMSGAVVESGTKVDAGKIVEKISNEDCAKAIEKSVMNEDFN